MKIFELFFDQFIPANIEDVWNFGSQPANLAKISPPQFKVKILFEGEVQENSIVKIRTRMHPLPLETLWLSRIEDLKSTGDYRKFRDVQLEGPFKKWVHDHIFESGTSPLSPFEKGTWVRDRVHYALPLGILGEWVEKLWIHKHLQEMFLYRQKMFSEIFSVKKLT